MKRHGAHFAIVGLAALLAAGCTVQPLYSPAPGESALSAPAALASIGVAEVDSRVGQQVRNRLIFLFGGGAGQPASADYELEIKVLAVTENALAIQTTVTDEPTAEKVTVSVNYRLVRTSDGVTVSNRKTRATASYDVSGQEFANTRAERDAENRAAGEVAERIRALVAADLKRARAI